MAGCGFAEDNGFLMEGQPDIRSKSTFSCGAVKINIALDFDAPLDDFKDYMA